MKDLDDKDGAAKTEVGIEIFSEEEEDIVLTEGKNVSLYLPHEKIVSQRSLQIMIPANENNNTDGMTVNLVNAGPDEKDDIILKTLQSIRSNLNISIDGKTSEHSHKMCSICCEAYVKGDDIAWSKNDNCCHAYHTDCIMEWLMKHDDCPMCRNDYLQEGGGGFDEP